ncbi:hypothetical protein [Listeria booriae]|uniref:Uncharacterized protein n=1 Tax=Listeria booriae TaxID=1552123 RepID=A0A7X0XPC7_9LIST|nr:hypothetical protein [Listeria booriae]MBC1210074.1 hypothetical protein [Listeria booriae]MBC1229330.1 hypothetical protein [Listeria booriae]MBC1306325.1 hypothetical protein [Listeria booriae]MBC1778104.1 hypothetical protein [Listeria booriae]
MKKTLEKMLIIGMALMLVLSTIALYGSQKVSGAVTDKPEKTTIKTYSSGIGKGYLDISWKAMIGATNYKILISNGYNYEYFLTGNVTTWSTKGRGIFPTKEEIEQGKYKFHSDGKGTEFACDPRSLYENGYKAGSTFGLRNQQKYIVRVMAIYSNGEGPTSDITDAYIPSDKLESGGIKTYSNGLGTGTGYMDVFWKPLPGAINYKVIISNGYNYEHFITGNVTSWTTKGKNIYPTKDEIKQGKYKFHTDGKGVEFAVDPRPLYENGYNSGSTFGLRNQERYIVRVMAIYSWGEGSTSDIIDAYMPPDQPIDKPEKPLIKSFANGDNYTGYMDFSWAKIPGAIDYKVIISNGYNYEYFSTANQTNWSTKDKAIFPTQEELDSGQYKFHIDGTGEEFSVDPRILYENGYNAGSTFGLNGKKKYIARIMAVYPWGNGATSDIAEAYLPETTSSISEYDEVAEEYGYIRASSVTKDEEQRVLSEVDLQDFKADLEAERVAELELSQNGDEDLESYDSLELEDDVISVELDENGLPVESDVDDEVSNALLRNSNGTKTYTGTEKMPVFGFISKLKKYAKVTRKSGKVTKVSVWAEVSGLNYPIKLEVTKTWHTLNNGKKNGVASYRVKKFKYILPGLPDLGYVSYNTATLKF